MKIVILFANYGPYHISRLQAFQKSCSSFNWESIGIQLAQTELEYPWEVQTNKLSVNILSVTKNKALENISLSELLANLFKLLNEVCPDVLVISGYFRLSMLAAFIWGIWHKKLMILLSESTENDAPRSWWRENFKRSIIKKYKSALVGGKPQKRYLMKLGMPTEAIFLGYDVVGNDAFHPNKIKSLSSPLEKSYFLAINRFIPKKNLLFLISTYARYRQAAGENSWDLVLCGDGYLRPQLEQQIKKLGLNEFIHLPGFLQQNELLPYFAHAACFIHASTHEQWGLVVNEAMAAGLTVLVSNHCGCFEDLVLEGVNGFSFDPENSQQLTDLMLKVSSGEIDFEKMGQAALEYIQKFSPEYFARGLIQAIEYGLPKS